MVWILEKYMGYRLVVFLIITIASKLGNISKRNFICFSFSKIDGFFIFVPLNLLQTVILLVTTTSECCLPCDSISESESEESARILFRATGDDKSFLLGSESVTVKIEWIYYHVYYDYELVCL